MFAQIVTILTQLFSFVSEMYKNFKTTAGEKIESGKKKLREKIDHYKKTGRPKW